MSNKFADLGFEPVETVDAFDSAFKRTLGFEGGYTVDHAGSTNFGVTQDTYDNWRKKQGLPTKPVRAIDTQEAKQLYKQEYFDKPGFSKLPANVAGVLFDYGVNAGTPRAAMALQKAVGASPDGVIGPKTLNKVNDFVSKNGEQPLLQKIVDQRSQHIDTLIKKNPAKYKKFENGWKNRINAIKSEFKLSDLNPFSVTEASADEVPQNDFADLGFEPASTLTENFDDLGFQQEQAIPQLSARKNFDKSDPLPEKMEPTQADFDFFTQNLADKLATASSGQTVPEMIESKNKLNGIIMRAPMLATLPVAPIASAVIEGLTQAKNLIVSNVKKEKYSPIEIRVLNELLPKETPTAIRIAAMGGEALTDVALLGGLSNLAKQGLLKDTIKEIGMKLERAGYGTGQKTINMDVVKEAARGSTLDIEAERWLKAKLGDVKPKNNNNIGTTTPEKPIAGITEPTVAPKTDQPRTVDVSQQEIIKAPPPSKEILAEAQKPTTPVERAAQHGEVVGIDAKSGLPVIDTSVKPTEKESPILPFETNDGVIQPSATPERFAGIVAEAKKTKEIKSVIEQAGGKFKAITNQENSLYEDEPTIYYDTPSGSTQTIRPSQLNVENVKSKIDKFENIKPVEAAQTTTPNLTPKQTEALAPSTENIINTQGGDLYGKSQEAGQKGNEEKVLIPQGQKVETPKAPVSPLHAEALKYPTAEEFIKSRIDFNQEITDIIDRNVFKDIVSPSIQNDGQKILDAINKNDFKKIEEIQSKYFRDKGIDENGSGVGPKKVSKPRNGAVAIWNTAQKILDKKSKLTAIYNEAHGITPDTANAGKPPDTANAVKPSLKKSQVQFSDDDIKDIKTLTDIEINMPNGETWAYNLSDSSETIFGGTPSGHSETMQAYGPKESMKVLLMAMEGKPLTALQEKKVKELLADFRANIKPSLERLDNEIAKTTAELSKSETKEVISTFENEEGINKPTSQEASNITPSGQVRLELLQPERKELFQEEGELFKKQKGDPASVKPTTESNLDKVEREITSSAIDHTKEPEKKFSAGLSIQKISDGKTRVSPSLKVDVNDTLNGDVKFLNPETEQRYKNAQGVFSQNKIKTKIHEMFTEFAKRATRTYPELENSPKYAELKNILDKHRISKQVAQDRAIRIIDGITAGFGPVKKDVFTRKIILDDLINEAKNNRAIPFGYSKYDESGSLVIDQEALSKDYENINKIVENNPDIKLAVEKRNKIQNAIAQELVNSGILSEEQLKNNYYRHQVLEYANMKATFGGGKTLKTPKPGYAKGRKGSTYDINTNYVEAEFEFMAQALNDIETVKTIKAIEDTPLNISDKVRSEFKAAKETDPSVKFEDFIPEGYSAWQPVKGNVFYTAYSVPERAIAKMISGESIDGITEADVHKILAIGAKRKQLILPDGVVKTLDKLYEIKDDNVIVKAATFLTNKWKGYILVNPRRFFKYNLQNFIGDFDAVIAGDPRILKKFNEANSELVDVFYHGKEMSQDLREYFERGGISSQLTVSELPELNDLEIFKRLSSGQFSAKNLNIWDKYWESVGKFTTYREAILRYAAYKHYKELYGKGEIKDFGASKKEDILALKNVKDQAAKVATELLGDYANITAFGKDMRQTLAPFWSWYEVNLKRYARLTANSFDKGWEEGIKTSATLAGLKGTAFLAKWLFRAMLLTGGVTLYNHLAHPDIEDNLSQYDRSRLHINIGKTKDGRIVILRTQSAFGDILEWLGLDGAPTLTKQYFDGKASLGDIFGTIPFTNIPAFGLNPLDGEIGLHPAVLKVLRAIGPLYKVPTETLTGYSWGGFDDKEYKIEDRKRNIARLVSLENEYDAIVGNPSRGYFKSLAEAFVSISDPEENAYRYIQSLKYQYKETVLGQGGSSDYYSPNSILYRKYKKAVRLGDKKVAEKVMSKMKEKGIDKEGLKRSLEASDPLFGLSKKDKVIFEKTYLSDSDRERLKRARTYYKKVFLGQ